MIPFDNKRQDKTREETRPDRQTTLTWPWTLLPLWRLFPYLQLMLLMTSDTQMDAYPDLLMFDDSVFSFRLDDWLWLMPRPDQARPDFFFLTTTMTRRDKTRLFFPSKMPYPRRLPNLTTRFHGVVGYHIILTWWGSPDRTRVEPFLSDLLTLDSSLLHLWWDAHTSLPLTW